MSIEQFGESLLGDIRKRRQKEARRARKQAERQALLGLGVNIAAKIGNEMLANKTRDFIKQEPVWSATQTQNKALDNSSYFLNIENQINARTDGGDDILWAMENLGGEFESIIARNVPDKYVGEAGPYREWLENEKKKMAKDWVENEYRPGLELAKQISSKEDFESMVALNAKRAAPNNLGSWLTRKSANVLGGKSEEDIELEALEAITEGRMAENAEKLNTFMETYRSLGDMTRAYDVANIVFPEQEISEDERYNINRTDRITNIDDQLVVYQEIEKTDRNTGEKLTEINIEERQKPKVVFKPDADPDEINLDVIKSLNTIFNFDKDGRNVLTETAFTAFVAEATGDGLNVQAPKTVAEHDKLQAIYRTYLTNEKNLQNQFKNQQTLKIFDLIVGEPEEFMNMLNSALVEDDPEKRRIGMQNLTMDIVRKMGLAEQLLKGEVIDYRTLQ